jgi:hypothetical protein
MYRILLLCVLILGCRATHVSQNHGVPVRDNISQMLDLVLSNWVKEGPDMRSIKELDEAIVLMRKNLPLGYQPQVAGRRILIADQFIAKRSSYAQIVELRMDDWVVLREGEVVERLLGLDSSPQAKIGPHCLQIDKVEVRGVTGRIKISQNRRFNLGSSGGTYLLKRTDSGWTLKLTEVWLS